VTDELPVHVSREGLHSLEVPESVEVTGPFDVRLINHAEPLHVHLHLDDPLSEVAAIEAGNHYVERESERFVRVDVDTDRLDGETLFGKLKVASAYGAETRWVDVEVVEPEVAESSVRVDESLAQPQPSREPAASGAGVDPKLVVLGLGLVAFAVAVAAAVLIQQTIVLLGSLAAIGGVLVALFFLLQGE